MASEEAPISWRQINKNIAAVPEGARWELTVAMNIPSEGVTPHPFSRAKLFPKKVALSNFVRLFCLEFGCKSFKSGL